MCPTGATQAQCQSGAVACEQGIDDQKIKSVLLRLTWQISPRNKFSACTSTRSTSSAGTG